MDVFPSWVPFYKLSGFLVSTVISTSLFFLNITPPSPDRSVGFHAENVRRPSLGQEAAAAVAATGSSARHLERLRNASWSGMKRMGESRSAGVVSSEAASERYRFYDELIAASHVRNVRPVIHGGRQLGRRV